MEKNLLIIGLIAVLGTALILAGCGKDEQMPTESAEIDFVTDYETVLAKAESTGQYALIDFYTDWCTWCKVLDTVTYVDPAVVAMSDSVIFAKINAEVDTAVAQKYKVQGYPTIVMINSEGEEVDRIGGYLPPDEFIETVHNYMEGKGTLAAYLAQADTNATVEVNYLIGEKYYGRGMYDDAVKYYQMVIEEDPKNEQGFTLEAMNSLGYVYTRQGDYDNAIATYNKIIDQFSDSAEVVGDALISIGSAYIRAEQTDKAVGQFDKVIKQFDGDEIEAEARLWKGYAYRVANDTANAISVYESFLKEHPESPDTLHAREKLEALRGKAS